MRDHNHKNRMKKRQAMRSRTSAPTRQNFGGEVASEACGCTVSGNGLPEQPWRIVYCEEHKSAYELFNKPKTPMCCPECQEVECDPECSDPRKSR